MPEKQPREASLEVEQPLSVPAARAEIPFMRCRVVYRGAKTNMSVAMPGSILISRFEDPAGAVEVPDRDGTVRKYREIRRAVSGGMTSYDFSTHDLKGDLIRERLMPQTAREDLRGKPFSWVEHAGHLVEFYLGVKDRNGVRQQEFEVMVKPEHQEVLKELVRATQRRESQRRADLAEVTS